MKNQKTPMRMCIACREMKDKKDLVRIVKSPEGDIALDFTLKKNGRGAYICKNQTCIDKCVKSKMLHKTFKCEIDNSIYQSIKEEFANSAK